MYFTVVIEKWVYNHLLVHFGKTAAARCKGGDRLSRCRVRDREDHILSVDLRSPSEPWGGPTNLDFPLTHKALLLHCLLQEAFLAVILHVLYLEGSLPLACSEHVLVASVGVCALRHAGLPQVLRTSYLL